MVRTLVALIGVVVLSGCGRAVSPLAGAARRGDVAAIKELVSQGADLNAGSGVNGWTPLQHAIHKNQAPSVLALVKAGADLHLGDPLSMAAAYGYTDIVKILLAHGADPHATAADGSTALDAAVLGANDIDRFTIADCQLSTAQALLESAPDLKLRASAAQRRVEAAKLKGCAGLERLVSGH